MILDAVRQQLSQYDYAYYGDTAHVPYGDRSEAEIYELTKAGVTHLFEQEQCLLVVVACNTSSAETVRRLQQEFIKEQYPERKILGVIVPTIETLVRSDCKNVLLIGTERTVSSNKYQVELDKLHATIELTQVPTSQLVPLLEVGDHASALDLVLSLKKTLQYLILI